MPITVERDPKTGKFVRSPEAISKRIDDEAFKKATAAVAKAFLTGNAAQMQSAATGGPQKPGTSWSNQGGTSSALIARVTQNLAQSFGRAPAELELAMAEQGLSWGPPFPPGRPLDPFWGYRRPPRTWDFAVGENVQITPRWDRISFETIKAIYDSYDVAQILVRRLINNVRSLEYDFQPMKGVTDDVSAEVDQARAFFELPDRRQPFRAWLAEYLQDVLRYDAGCLYIRRNEAGEPIALEVVDGTTMIPLIDFYGRVAEDEDDNQPPPEGQMWPGEITPAYLQIIEGLPWVWLTADDILYQPWNPLPNSQYGLSPLEAVLLTANTDLRFQWHFLQYFTEGTLPAGFMEAPPDQSDPDSLAEWQETWDAIMLGDQAKLRQVRWVPAESKWTPAKNSDFDDKFPLYLMRRVCASYGVTPNDLGFTENVNRSSGDTQIDVQFRVGIVPLMRHVEDVLNLFISQHLHLRVRLAIDDGGEIEDRVATAQANQIYVNAGVKGTDEVRAELGLPVDRSQPVGRYIMNPKIGAQPLLQLTSTQGKLNPETFAPLPGQEMPKPPAPTLPPGTPPNGAEPPEMDQQAPDGTPDNAPGESEEGLKSALAMIDVLLDKLGVSKDGSGGPGVTGGTMSTGGPLEIGAPDNTGGPGVTRGFSNPTTITGGLMVDTDLQGVDLDDDDEEEDEDEDATKMVQQALNLRRWRDNARTRLRKGLQPRRFMDVDASFADPVWAKLKDARTREEVDEAFKAAGGGGTGPKGRPGPYGHLEEALVTYWQGPVLAALAASLVPGAVAAAWLQQTKALAGMAQSPEAFAEALSLNHEPLQEALTQLYSASWPAGVKDAVAHLGRKVSDIAQRLADFIGDLWKPSDVPDGDELEGMGFEDFLDAVNTWIQEMDGTTRRQVAQALTDGMAEGESTDQIAARIDQALHNPKRAMMIARTEVNRAMSRAALATYRANGVQQWDLLTAADPCPICAGIAASNPHSIADTALLPPEHPMCRCSAAPA